MANLAGGSPPVDFYDSSVGIAGHPLKDRHKLREGKVRDLSSPQALHCVEIQVLDADDGIFPNKLVRQFKEPIASAVADTLVYAPKIANRPITVVAAFLAARYRTVSGPKLIERGFIPLWRIYHRTVVQIEEMFQTEIYPDSFTCSRKDVVTFLLRDNDEIELSQRIALHCEGFDATFNGTGFEIFVFPSHDGDTITVFMENVPRLLERETFVSFALAKMRWGLSAVSFLFYMIEECAVRTVNPFSHILNSLTPKSLPLRMERFLDIRDVLH